MALAVTELDFQRMLTSAGRKEILIPSVHKLLFDPTFTGFDVNVEPWYAKEYDGWFHPSSQSTWSVRQLYLYLVAPQMLQEEHMPLTGVLAVTVGKFWHRFFQMLWMADGTLVQDEYPIEHAETNRRGHADGLLASGELLEIKSINEFQAAKVIDEASLKDKKYPYWAQTQDYLDCTGIDAMRYFIIHPAYPFPMTEFVVKADKVYNAKRRGDYIEAMRMAALYPRPDVLEDVRITPIEACCAPGSTVAKKCPVRGACPIGRFAG